MSRYDDLYATPQDERADELQDVLQALPKFREDALANAEGEQLARLVAATEPGSLWLAMELLVARNVERSIAHRPLHESRCDSLEALIREYTPPLQPGQAPPSLDAIPASGPVSPVVSHNSTAGASSSQELAA